MTAKRTLSRERVLAFWRVALEPTSLKGDEAVALGWTRGLGSAGEARGRRSLGE